METIQICDIVAKCAAIGSTVESISKRLELFLSCGIPDLKSHDSVVDQDFLLTEVSTNCGLRLTLNLTIQVLLEQSSLSYTGVSQNNDLQKVLLS